MEFVTVHQTTKNSRFFFMSTETEQPGIGPWKRKKIRHPPPTISPYPTRKPKPDDSSSPSSALREWRSDQWPNGSWFSAQRPRVKCKCNSNSSDCPHPVFQFEECKKLSLVGQLLQKYQIKKENGKGIGFDKEQGQFIPWDLFKSHLQKTIQLSATTSPYPNGIKRFEFEKCIVWTDLPNPEALRVWLPLKSLQDSGKWLVLF